MIPHDDARDARHRKILAGWLLLMCFMVLAMVVLGGATRLTHSGLSMANWSPATGWLPPMNEAAWAEMFALYKQTPEFQKINNWMTVEDFKEIFWLEFIHRVWGRLIGLMFLLPLLFFVIKGWVGRALVPRLVMLFVLGGLQGVMGWYMVKSGLVDRPDVSQYRLTAHLGLALLIHGLLLHAALDVMGSRNRTPAPVGQRRGALFLVFWVALVALSGGFVAGLDAGFAYNTFPLMDAGLWPDDLFGQTPWWISAFEHIGTVQFNHRTLAELTFVLLVAFWIMARRSNGAVHWLLGAGIVQICLGIATLVMVVPLSLGVLHQAGALILFSVAIWAAHELHGRAPVPLIRAAP